MTLALALLTVAQTHLALNLEASFKVSYLVKRDYRDDQAGEQIAMVERVTYQATAVGSGERRKFEVTTEPEKMIVDGQEFNQNDLHEKTVLSEERTPTGQVLNRQFHPSFASLRARQQRPLDWRFNGEDVSPGSEWSYAVPADDTLDTPAAEWHWSLDSVSKVEAVLKVSFTEKGRSRPVTADGTVTVSLADGWADALDVTVHSTMMPGDSENAIVDLHVTWTRLKP